ncbi:glucose-induced degradation protein 8 homolog [Tetranychus urticae]|uniref:CTLH domain-containing protein n=1 Tax=Tetranychus urticae TaxID=32264 RepID=T1K868_TETUR|nr:glucose-induced degradation protein 8 homolog [Tetranychus urticae]
MDNLPVKRYQINQLIMDYLVAQGFKEAAEKFKQEAGLNMQRSKSSETDPDTAEFNALLEQRIQIREAIEEGKIKYALCLINQYYPELIDQNRGLYFKLQQQQLIELIREQKTEEALSFAQEQLNVDSEYLELPELERTLALLAFDKPMNSPYADLLQLEHRQQLALEVNGIILQEQSGSADVQQPKIITLLKLLHWTQNELERKKCKFPKMVDLSTAEVIGEI